MATTTTNFGWTVPSDTDLVKDGAAAIRTALGGVDTSFVDLKGGTTGQVLSKASGTDLDFTWVAQDDSNAIQNAIVDAKGDLISATAADTPARLAVGTNGQVLTADSTASTGIKWATPSSGALTLIGTTTLTASGSFNLSSIFSSTYDDYEIHLSGVTASTSITIFFGARAGSTNKITNYNYMYYQVSTANGIAAAGGSNTTDGGSVDAGTSAATNAVIKVLNPYNSGATGFITDYVQFNAGGVKRYLQTESVSFDSMFFTLSSGTVTGKVYVYGYSK